MNNYNSIFNIQRFPFDWRTPAGYIFAVATQYTLTLYLFMYAATALSTALGGCFVGKPTVKDIRISINLVNGIANFDGNRIQMIEQLSDFVEGHSCLLELNISIHF